MIHFDHPWLLLLAPVSVLLLRLLRRPDPSRSRRRDNLSLAARMTVAFLLLGAAAEPSIVAPRRRPPLNVYAIDLSDSGDDAAVEESLLAVEEASGKTEGLSALIGFAGRAEVFLPPAPGPLAVPPDLRHRLLARRRSAELREAVERGDAAASGLLQELTARRDAIEPLKTRPDEAILAAQSLYRAGHENRTILVTDGRARELPSDPRVRYVAMPPPRRKDLVLRALQAPAAVRFGEPFDLRVEIESSHATEVSIQVAIDDVVQPGQADRFLITAPGRATVTLKNLRQDRPLDPGLHRILVNATAPGDEEPRNNQAVGSTAVVGKLRALVVEGGPVEGEGLARLLTVQAVEYERIGADRLATRREDLGRFTAVILAGVAPSRLGREDAQALRSYVENGGGLLFIGSPRINDPEASRAGIAELLPVEFAPSAGGTGSDPSTGRTTNGGGKSEPRKVLAPTVALCLLVDKSGSMAGDNIKLAQEACIAAAKALTAKDLVSVIAFDASPRVILDFTPADRSQSIEERVVRIGADGGTHIPRALAAALAAFTGDPRAAKAGIKHCILLSDGKTAAGDLEETLVALREAGVRVSTVCVGNTDDFDFPLMQAIARESGGRARFTSSFNDVPQIFVDEARKVILESERRADEETPPVTPATTPSPEDPKPHPGSRTVAVVAKDDHEILSGIEKSFPPLHGLLGGTARPSASVPAATADGAPVLAVWRFGLGKSAAWMSDLGGAWSRDWASWGPTSKLFAQLVRHLSSAADDLDLASRVRVEGDRLRIERRSASEGFEAHLLLPRKTDLKLEPAADGALEARLPLGDGPGAVVVAVTRPRDQGAETLPLIAARAHPAELDAPSDSPSRLAAAGGRPLAELARVLATATIDPDARTGLALWSLVLALGLLPLDVAVRRLR